jgi:hypothetical protein
VRITADDRFEGDRFGSAVDARGVDAGSSHSRSAEQLPTMKGMPMTAKAVLAREGRRMAGFLKCV